MKDPQQTKKHKALKNDAIGKEGKIRPLTREWRQAIMAVIRVWKSNFYERG